MDAERLVKLIKNALVTRGMKGTISLGKAREIKAGLLEDIRKKGQYKNYNICIDLSPVHNVGGGMMCDCKKTRITVKPANTEVTVMKKS
jgi:hypothetical protein